MRRLFLPLIVLGVMVVAIALTIRANDAANPDDPTEVTVADSLTTPLLSPRRAPEWLRRPTADGRLATATAAVLTGAEMPELRCLRVDRGSSTLVEDSAGLGLMPGQTQRLVTLAALDVLGAARNYTTSVVRDRETSIDNGTLSGNLYLVGGGDPVLTTGPYAEAMGGGPTTSLEQLADAVVDELAPLGVTEIAGRVIGDESRYTPIENDYVGGEDDFWDPSVTANNLVGPLTALMVDHGFTFDAGTGGVSPAADPALAAARTFAALLAERGITARQPATTGTQPAAAAQLGVAVVESPELETIAARALADPTTAEMLLKEIGVRNGVQAARAFAAFQGVLLPLSAAGFPVEGSFPVDGSGISDQNLSTCDLLVSVLGDGGGAVSPSSVLPSIADTDLAECAPDTGGQIRVYGAARGDLTSIAGRFEAENGDIVTFALIANRVANPDAPAEPWAPCNNLQRTLLSAVAGHPYGPDLDDVGPLPVEARRATLRPEAMSGTAGYELAMFPLEHGMLPGAVIPLHIFEPRYRRLATDVTSRDEPEFGVAMIERGREVGGGDDRADVGVVARVLQSEEFPDGRWGIVAAGTRRIRIREWLPDEPYPRARVENWPDDDPSVDEATLGALHDGVRRVYAAARRLQPDLDVADPELGAEDPATAMWRAIHAAQLGPLDNLVLLRAPGCATRATLAAELVRDRAEVLEALADERG